MEELLQKIKGLYPYMADDKIAEILSLGEIIMLDEGQAFVKAGEKTRKAGIVLQGLMRNYFINDEGEQVTVVFATEMQAIAPYTAIFLNKPASETTEAVEPSVIYAFEFESLKQLTLKDPIYLRLYADFVERAFVLAIQRIEDFTNTKPQQRYQRLLDNHGYLIEHAPLKYLASYLGITPVSLSRIRKRMTGRTN